MRKTLLGLPVVLSLSLFLGGCGGEAVTKLEERVTALEAQVKEHDSKLTALQGDKTAVVETTTTTTSTSKTPAETGAQSTAAFSDISGMFGEKEIKDLVRVGVLDASSGKFNPTAPITRAEFVTWLVKSNNALRPDKMIRPAEPGAKSTFPDLPTTHPFFKYVQGMADAGWSIGYVDKTFKPDKDLNREEMMGIKTLFDEQVESSNGAEWCLQHGWTDWKKISEPFKSAMGMEALGQANWGRVYGKTKSCDPQKTVSRAEGAVCVWQVGRFPVNAGATK